MPRFSLTSLVPTVFRRPRRRRMSRSRPVTTAFECLEPKRLLSGTGWEPGLNFESESNDTRSSADTLAATTASRPDADVVITGGIRTTNDVDYYRFTLHSQANVQLDLYKLHPDRFEFRGDLDLAIENSSGATIARSIRGGGRPERIEATLDAGTYFARVYPYDSTGFGESYQLRLQADGEPGTVPPGRSTVTGPGGTSDTTPTFRWTAASNATRYELWVYNRDTADRVIHNQQITGTSYTPSIALEDGRHYVWVRAWNGATPGDWSAGHAFDLQATTPAPGATRVTGPGDTTDTTPELRWTEADRATHYELWVNSSGGGRVLYRDRVEGTSFVPDTALQAGRHHLWVRPWNGTVAGSWSAAHSFTVTSGTLTSRVTGPADTNDATPTFTWTQSAGATHYELWVSNRTSGQRAVYEARLQGTSFTTPRELPSGNYSVWIRAWNGSQRGDWSARHDFELTAGQNPDPNGINNSRSQSIATGSRTTTDLLTSTDDTDYYHVSTTQRYPRIRFEFTIEVDAGNAADIGISLEDGNGSLISTDSYSVTRNGNRITVSSGDRYLYMRFRGLRVHLKLQLLPGASDVRYSLSTAVRTTV